MNVTEYIYPTVFKESYVVLLIEYFYFYFSDLELFLRIYGRSSELSL